MSNERPREEDISKKNVRANKPSEEEVVRKTLEEKGPMPDKDHEEIEPAGLSSDHRM